MYVDCNINITDLVLCIIFLQVKNGDKLEGGILKRKNPPQSESDYFVWKLISYLSAENGLFKRDDQSLLRNCQVLWVAFFWATKLVPMVSSTDQLCYLKIAFWMLFCPFLNLLFLYKKIQQFCFLLPSNLLNLKTSHLKTCVDFVKFFKILSHFHW